MSATLELFDLIGELARRRYQLAETSFATLGLNHTEARLLSLLAAAGGASAQDALSNRLTVDRTNAGRALTRLDEAGYIERRKDSVDKRANRVHITAKGRRTVSAIARLRSEMAAAFFGEMTSDEAAGIVCLFRERLALAAPASGERTRAAGGPSVQ
ncbi:MAG: MarR family transcriptional regulator [Bryobacterales bacterium]|nr:MarR family transcriptional regulator [Bryobacterales bacterium]